MDCTRIFSSSLLFCLACGPPDLEPPGEVAGPGEARRHLVSPIAGPEFTPDRPVRGGPSTAQVQHAMARGENQHLLAWYQQDGYHAARLDNNGRLLDRDGLALFAGDGFGRPDGAGMSAVAYGSGAYLVAGVQHSYPLKLDLALIRPTGEVARLAEFDSGASSAVAADHDGANFLLVWARQHIRAGEGDIFFTRVSGDGRPLDPFSYAAAVPGAQERPQVAFDGTNHLIVWEEHRNGTADIYGARVTRAGRVLDPGGFPIARGAGEQRAPHLAYDATQGRYIVVWEGDGRIYGAAVGRDRRVGPRSVIPSPTRDEAPQVAVAGGSAWVVFQRMSYDAVNERETSTIHGVTASLAGDALTFTGAPALLSPGANQPLHSFPVIVTDGAGFLTAWQDGWRRTIEGRRLDAWGPLPSPMRLASGYPNVQEGPFGAAGEGGGAILVWRDFRTTRQPPGQESIYAAVITDQGTSLTPAGVKLVGYDYNGQALLGAGADPGGYLVVTQDQLRRMDRSGKITGRASFDWGALGASMVERPRLFFDGSNYLMVFAGVGTDELWPYIDHRIFGVRLSPAGVPLDAAALTIARHGWNSGSQDHPGGAPAAAFDGTQTRVVWLDIAHTDPPTPPRMSTRAVDLTGRLTGTERTLASGRLVEGAPALAFGGADFLLAWPVHVGGGRILGLRLRRDGAPLWGAPRTLYQAAAGTVLGKVSLAAHGTGYLLQWEESDGSWQQTLYGLRLRGDGAALDAERQPLSEPRAIAGNSVLLPGRSGKLLSCYQTFLSYPTPDGYATFYARLGARVITP